MECPECWEYKLLRSSHIDIQKVLNQWKHQFVIDIISMSQSPGGSEPHISVLMRRKKL